MGYISLKRNFRRCGGGGGSNLPLKLTSLKKTDRREEGEWGYHVCFLYVRNLVAIETLFQISRQ